MAAQFMEEIVAITEDKKFPCLFLDCDQDFASRLEMFSHIKDSHNPVLGAILENLFSGNNSRLIK